MKIMKEKWQQGFTMIELMSVVSLLSLLTVLFWGPEFRTQVKEIQQKKIEVMVEEIRRLGSAAQTFTLYNHGEWPHTESDCRDSHLFLHASAIDRESSFYTPHLSAGGYLPFSIGSDESQAVGQYYFYCPQTILTPEFRAEFIIRIALHKRDEDWTAYAANQLAGAKVTSNAYYAGLEVAFPVLSAIPALDALLPRDGSLAMQGDLDMGRGEIHNVTDVITATQQTLASVPLLHVVARPGNNIQKPSCPENYEPQILVMPQEIAHSSGEPITKFQVWAQDSGSFWRIQSRVFSTYQIDLNNSQKVLAGVTVKCTL